MNDDVMLDQHGAARYDASAMAAEIDAQIRALPKQTTEPIRRIRREYSQRLRGASGSELLAIAEALVGRQRWVAYELLYHHPSRLAGLGVEEVERLGQGLDGWVDVDTFARYISGPAWQQGQLPDEAIHRWAASPNRYWRRAALVSTVPLNLRAAGGPGDTRRTLEVCGVLANMHGDLSDGPDQRRYQAWKQRQIARGMAITDADAMFQGLPEVIHFVSEERTRDLLHEAGFVDIEPVFRAFVIGGWLARRSADG